MKFSIERDAILKPLQAVVGATERKQTMQILGNVLMQINSHQLLLTATDTEVELSARVTLVEPAESGVMTAPARKLIDICKNLPSDSMLEFTLDDDRLLLKSGRSRFTLTTLPAEDFPSTEDDPGVMEFNLASQDLLTLIESTHFSMAQQDVRYYLNGLLLELKGQQIATVATDGHRLAICRISTERDFGLQQVIIPRKGIQELVRLLGQLEEDVLMTITQNHCRVAAKDFTFTSKLIEGRFPDYERVIPESNEILVTIDRDILRDALTRVSILSNEKYRGVGIILQRDQLRLIANNPEMEQAEEELNVSYTGGEVELGFNVGYLIDCLNALPAGDVQLGLRDANSSVMIEAKADANSSYVVMPMRI